MYVDLVDLVEVVDLSRARAKRRTHPAPTDDPGGMNDDELSVGIPREEWIAPAEVGPR